MYKPASFIDEFEQHVDLRLRVNSMLPYAFEYKHYHQSLSAINQELIHTLRRMEHAAEMHEGSTTTLTIPTAYRRAREQLERTVDSLMTAINLCDQLCRVK